VATEVRQQFLIPGLVQSQPVAIRDLLKPRRVDRVLVRRKMVNLHRQRLASTFCFCGEAQSIWAAGAIAIGFV
jgi:hypothetical protein